MASSASKSPAVLLLVCGDDEFSVKRAARDSFEQWGEGASVLDQEIIDASVSNSGGALKAVARLREALQTFPFFGGSKVIWFQNRNFLGDERTASTQAVCESLLEWRQELQNFRWHH